MSLKKIQLNDREELHVEFQQWKGRAFADLRVYAGPNDEVTKWPTGKGFLVPLSRLRELQKAIAELETETHEASVR